MILKKLYITEIIILGMWSIASKFHFEDHLLKVRGKNQGVLRHKKSSILHYKLLAERDLMNELEGVLDPSPMMLL